MASGCTPYVYCMLKLSILSIRACGGNIHGVGGLYFGGLCDASFDVCLVLTLGPQFMFNKCIVVYSTTL